MNTIFGSNRWPNHDISTLKLLQLIHRHGDRAPVEKHFPPNDPFKYKKYWPSGLGELTAQGRYRMYSLGQFIRKEYNEYLGPEYSPREVYARSSLTDRCIESVSCLLAGAYPPLPQHMQWTNSSQLGRVWQPIAFETLMPRNRDIMLNTKHCPVCDREFTQVLQSDSVKKFLSENTELFRNLSQIVGRNLRTISDGHHLHDVLNIETTSGYYWTHVWTIEEEQKIVNQLYKSHLMSYAIGWDRPTTKRLRAGGLVKELIKNIEKVTNNTNDKKLYVYSTHDILIVALLHALNAFDNTLPSFGSTLMFELHKYPNKSTGANIDPKEGYFVEVYYLNETLTGSPYAIQQNDCQNKISCPLDMFLDSTKHLIYENFDKECQTLDGFVGLRDEESNQYLI